MFIEVLVLDLFNKTPVALDPLDTYFSNLYIEMEVFSPTDTKL
jgi:hypothetical protein